MNRISLKFILRSEPNPLEPLKSMTYCYLPNFVRALGLTGHPAFLKL